MRSNLLIVLVLNIGCRQTSEEKFSNTAEAKLEEVEKQANEPLEEHEIDALEADTAQETDTDTASPEDTAVVDTGTPVVEPSGFIAEWVVANESVTLDSIVLPRLLTHTNDLDVTYTVTELKVFIGAANAAWPTAIGDTRLGVGTTDQHIGLYERYDTFCGSYTDGNTYCSNEWWIDTTSSALTVDSATPIDFGFTMAFFSQNEMVAETANLHDGVADLMRMYAIVNWTASNGVSGESTTEGLFTITAPE